MGLMDAVIREGNLPNWAKSPAYIGDLPLPDRFRLMCKIAKGLQLLAEEVLRIEAPDMCNQLFVNIK